MDARYGLTWQETKSFKFNACRHVYQRHCRHPNIHSSLGHTRGAKNKTGINIHLEATPKFPFNNKHRVLQPHYQQPRSIQASTLYYPPLSCESNLPHLAIS
ncbi:hypothetical protein TNCT_658841 [Trichonephila clavata]|uniref:Uncharacterized protein n=1 Tax=Trichonephila clavata TaxID=2740835 RepID=A0A8X6FTQ1_TRICU|nr:hypothetical protein TNCT_658841 [Trichonephila clavata]